MITKRKRSEITNITRHEDAFHIEVDVKKAFFHDVHDYYFFLKERDGYGKIKVDVTKKGTKGPYVCFELFIKPPLTSEPLMDKQTWDLYILTNMTSGHTTAERIQYKNSHAHLLTIVDHKQMFYPYATVKSNVSFVVSPYELFADFENVRLSNKGMSFEGYFYFPPMAEDDTYQLITMFMVVEKTHDGETKKIPLQVVQRQDNQIGFAGFFDIETEKPYEDKESYKFFFELTYKNDHSVETIRSNRLRWIQDHQWKTTRKIVRNRYGKIKIQAVPSKKGKYLSLQIAHFKWRTDMIQRATSAWVQFRRSPFVRQMYTHAFRAIGTLPKQNIIVFESFHGKQFSCSPRAIYEYIRNENMNYKTYWSVDRRHLKEFEKLDLNILRRFSLKWLFLMARSKYWITNSRLPLWLPKPKGTNYIQTWHGTPLKKLGIDIEEVHMPGTNTYKYKENFIREARKWNVLVSPNTYSTHIFRRAFQFNETMIESGYPRNDFLINQNNDQTIRAIKEKCQLPLHKKIILYAPTWRDNQFYEKGKYKFDLQLDVEKMRRALGDEYILLLRLHYLVSESLDLCHFDHFVYDFSRHEDIRELYLIADMLITDYSSVFFDYANLKRPMLFYVYDIEEYRDKLRGFYFDFERMAPGPLVKTTDELIAEIQNIHENGYTPSEKMEAFYNKFCSLEDGRASERVVKEVFKSS